MCLPRASSLEPETGHLGGRQAGSELPELESTSPWAKDITAVLWGFPSLILPSAQETEGKLPCVLSQVGTIFSRLLVFHLHTTSNVQSNVTDILGC